MKTWFRRCRHKTLNPNRFGEIAIFPNAKGTGKSLAFGPWCATLPTPLQPGKTVNGLPRYLLGLDLTGVSPLGTPPMPLKVGVCKWRWAHHPPCIGHTILGHVGLLGPAPNFEGTLVPPCSCPAPSLVVTQQCSRTWGTPPLSPPLCTPY